ncbi:DEAD/DEAH box helicase family protein [Modestobacter sp. VKM Ac-2977]|uniref:BPTD_3080 family restriction endonuclease n=1 Tax=Modestobacter sp. VKM Ac-2977 TaxID=3004131 RepID=UPI0022AA8552|nr:DEAD/DEAH box helicase family protein [Modestobacter sp. VKM Ac-2977]MCZ2821051.1 DEAD/DEAH box helicase family protein [Modestobacter sp. VKM Ac-2977]
MTETLETSPILNGPYDPPGRYYEMGSSGRTNTIIEGRRPSESYIPIPTARKGNVSATGFVQDAIDFDLTGERRERNSFVNDLRREVERWRHRDYERVTPTSRKLLQHWADPDRENRVLFAQREAAETAIFLAEVAGRHGYADWRRQIDEANGDHNSGLPRVALKMATGSGKTVVMAMLIAWQTANKVLSPRDARFAKRFLIVAPGITIRDRLQVLQPGHPGNYYDERDLLPSDLRAAVQQAQIVITNYHSFLLRDAKEIKGVAANTKKILLAGKAEDPFKETPEAMVARVLRNFAGRNEQIVVFNDEAHHCYQDKPIPAAKGAPASQTKEDLETARVWFKGLQAIQRKVGIKTIFDLSATPFYLGGSGYSEGYIFPWVVSDFSLMDAIESGIVKIPRTPVDDDATGNLVTYLRLWDYVGAQLPKKRLSSTESLHGWVPPAELEGALKSLYSSYNKAFDHWETTLAQHGEPPPVFIVVCPNTVVSKLVYDYIAGKETDGGVLVPGELARFSNAKDGQFLTRPRTILVDSAQLESGEAMKPDFKQAAAAEIEAFKADFRRRNPGADAESLTDEDLLREVMNTVGKKGKLGEGVRCVVSVAMLTEGWDANTVTHILGIRAFGSQLLCEQVVGRGLRRRSYALGEDGKFEPEYANVYGIPFAFIPSDKTGPDPLPRPPAIMVESLPGREHLRIEFPKLDGYRVEIPDERLMFDASTAEHFPIGPSTVPTRTDVEGVVGKGEIVTDDEAQGRRRQEVAYRLAARLLRTHLTALGDDPRPWLFPQLVEIAQQWLEQCVDIAPGYAIGHLLTSTEGQAEAAEAIYGAIAVQVGNRRERLRPMIRRFDPVGSTAEIAFPTRKAVVPADKSEVSHVTLDGKDGNTWEQLLADECELHRDVLSYVKNDHLGFVIPYVHKGRTHSYVPDFLVRLESREDDVVRTLIIEVSGGQKSPGSTKAKADTARDQWCVAVNNHGGFGRWGYVEITTMLGVRARLSEAIDSLYADDPIVGDPDLLDYDEVTRGA